MLAVSWIGRSGVQGPLQLRLHEIVHRERKTLLNVPNDFWLQEIAILAQIFCVRRCESRRTQCAKTFMGR